MTWWHKEPGHQHPHYGPICPGLLCFQHQIGQDKHSYRDDYDNKSNIYKIAIDKFVINGTICLRIKCFQSFLTWFWCILNHMIFLHWTNAATKHDGFHPLASFTIRHFLPKRACKSSQDRFAEFVAVVWCSVAGLNSNVQRRGEVGGILKGAILPRQVITCKMIICCQYQHVESRTKCTEFCRQYFEIRFLQQIVTWWCHIA